MKLPMLWGSYRKQQKLLKEYGSSTENLIGLSLTPGKPNWQYEALVDILYDVRVSSALRKSIALNLSRNHSVAKNVLEDLPYYDYLTTGVSVIKENKVNVIAHEESAPLKYSEKVLKNLKENPNYTRVIEEGDTQWLALVKSKETLEISRAFSIETLTKFINVNDPENYNIDPQIVFDLWQSIDPELKTISGEGVTKLKTIVGLERKKLFTSVTQKKTVTISR